MTLLLREVGRFLLEAGLWVGAISLVAAAVALPLLWKLASPIDRRDVGLAVVGAAVMAAVGHRLGLVPGWAPDIGGHALPVLWAAAGAATTVLTAVASRRRRAV